jgi:hypothetical protein
VTLSRDGVAGLVCLAGALLLLWLSRALPHPPLVPIGPAFYPRILLGVTALLAAALVVSDLAAARHPPRPAASYRLVLLTFAVFTLYVFALPRLGFRLATFAFVAALAAALDAPRGARRWALVLAVALATTVVTYVVFERYLSVLLPRGTLTGF